MPVAPRHAIFLSGPIGAGKSTLGPPLAAALDGGFVEADDHADHDKPWYCSSLTSSVAVVRASLAVLEDKPAVIVATPLRCVTWIYFRRTFAEAQIRTLFIGLHAPAEAILAAARGRRFDAEEADRIRAMIAQGYGERPFFDLIVRTGRGSIADTLAQLTGQVRRLMVAGL